jgi:hypothetical protein
MGLFGPGPAINAKQLPIREAKLTREEVAERVGTQLAFF